MSFVSVEMKMLYKENITLTQFKDLLEEDLFLDYFNKFLCLPIFPQCLLIEKSKPWIFKMYPKLNDKYKLDADGVLQYLWERMYRAFIETKFYVEYLIAKELLLAPMTQSIDNRVAGFEDDCQNLVKNAVSWLKSKCLGGALALRKFRDFMTQYPEAYKLFQYWLDVEYLYQSRSSTFSRSFELLKRKYFHCNGIAAFQQQVLDAANDPSESRAYDVTFAFRLQHLCFQKISSHWLLNYLLISRVNAVTSCERSYMLLAHDFLRGEAPCNDRVEELHKCGDVINALSLVSTIRSNSPIPSKIQRIAVNDVSTMQPMTSHDEENSQERADQIQLGTNKMKKIRRWSVVNGNEYKLRFADGDAMNLYRIDYDVNTSAGNNLPKLKEAPMTSQDNGEMSLKKSKANVKKMDSGDFEVVLFEDYRDNDENRRIIAALQTDEAAAHPFQSYLFKYKDLESLHLFLFWRDVEQLRRNFRFCIKSFDYFLIALRQIADKYLEKNAPKQIKKDLDKSATIAQLRNSDYVTLPSRLRQLHKEVFLQIKPLFFEFWQKELNLFYEKAVYGIYDVIELKKHFDHRNEEDEDCVKKIKEVEANQEKVPANVKKLPVIYRKQDRKQDQDKKEVEAKMTTRRIQKKDLVDDEKSANIDLMNKFKRLKNKRDHVIRGGIKVDIMNNDDNVIKIRKWKTEKLVEEKNQRLPMIRNKDFIRSSKMVDLEANDIKLPNIKSFEPKQIRKKKSIQIKLTNKQPYTFITPKTSTETMIQRLKDEEQLLQDKHPLKFRFSKIESVDKMPKNFGFKKKMNKKSISLPQKFERRKINIDDDDEIFVLGGVQKKYQSKFEEKMQVIKRENLKADKKMRMLSKSNFMTTRVHKRLPEPLYPPTETPRAAPKPSESTLSLRQNRSGNIKQKVDLLQKKQISSRNELQSAAKLNHLSEQSNQMKPPNQMNSQSQLRIESQFKPRSQFKIENQFKIESHSKFQSTSSRNEKKTLLSNDPQPSKDKLSKGVTSNSNIQPKNLSKTIRVRSRRTPNVKSIAGERVSLTPEENMMLKQVERAYGIVLDSYFTTADLTFESRNEQKKQDRDSGKDEDLLTSKVTRKKNNNDKLKNESNMKRMVEAMMQNEIPNYLKKLEYNKKIPNGLNKIKNWTKELHKTKSPAVQNDLEIPFLQDINPLTCPLSFENMLQHEDHVVFFEQFLKLHNAESLLSNYNSIQNFQELEPEQREILVDTLILNHYLKPDYIPANKDLLGELARIQIDIKKKMKHKWFPRYQSIFKQDSIATPITKRAIARKDYVRKFVLDFFRRTIRFVASMRNKETASDFRNYLLQISQHGDEVVADKHANTEAGLKSDIFRFESENRTFYSNIARRRVNYQLLPNDFDFWIELDCYQRNSDIAIRNESSIRWILRKARLIYFNFLNSSLPPPLRVNIPFEMSEKVRKSLNIGIIWRSIFHAAKLHLLPPLLHFWSKFCWEKYSYNAIKKPSRYSVKKIVQSNFALPIFPVAKKKCFKTGLVHQPEVDPVEIQDLKLKDLTKICPNRNQDESSLICYSLSRGGYLMRNISMAELTLTYQRANFDKRKRRNPEVDDAESRSMFEVDKIDDDVSKEEMEARFMKIFRTESEMIRKGLY